VQYSDQRVQQVDRMSGAANDPSTDRLPTFATRYTLPMAIVAS
jgi:hypothetical protein